MARTGGVVFFHDRFARGMVAGILAGIPTLVVNQLSELLHLSQLRYLDFASIMILGNLPKTRWEAWFAFFITVGFLGTLGSVFALLIPVIKRENLVLKSITFSGMIWFLTYAITTLFKVPELQRISLKTALSNVIGAVVWGFVLGYALGWLEHKQPKNRNRVMRLVMKPEGEHDGEIKPVRLRKPLKVK